MIRPTPEAYAELQQAYDSLNKDLFDDTLPACLLTLQREKRTYGYFASSRFVKRTGEQCDEIALNPAYFGVCPTLEVLQTIGHEMCHLWQFHFGKPGRARYHNREWADKMESLGLMPSSTGKPGGRRVGDHMGDYCIEGGRFETVANDMMQRGFGISWCDRVPVRHVQPEVAETAIAMAEEATLILPPGMELGTEAPTADRSNRKKYSCPECATNVWGKPGLALVCGVCRSDYQENG